MAQFRRSVCHQESSLLRSINAHLRWTNRTNKKKGGKNVRPESRIEKTQHDIKIAEILEDKVKKKNTKDKCTLAHSYYLYLVCNIYAGV